MDQAENIQDNITKQNVDVPQPNQTFFTRYKNIIIITIAVIVFLILCCIMSFALLVGLIKNTGTLVIDENTSSNSAVTSMITATSFSTSNNSSTQSTTFSAINSSDNPTANNYTSKYFQFNSYVDPTISFKYPTGYKVNLLPENNSYSDTETAYDYKASFDGITSIIISNGKSGKDEHKTDVSVVDIISQLADDGPDSYSVLTDIRTDGMQWRVTDLEKNTFKYYDFEVIGEEYIPEIDQKLILLSFENGAKRVVLMDRLESIREFIAKGIDHQVYDPENTEYNNSIVFHTGHFAEQSFLGGNGKIRNSKGETIPAFTRKFDPNDPVYPYEYTVRISCGDLGLANKDAMLKCIDPFRALASTAVRFK